MLISIIHGNVSDRISVFIAKSTLVNMLMYILVFYMVLSFFTDEYIEMEHRLDRGGVHL